MLRANSPGSVIRYWLSSEAGAVAAAAAFVRLSGSFFRPLPYFCASARSFMRVLSEIARLILCGDYPRQARAGWSLRNEGRLGSRSRQGYGGSSGMLLV